jgi:hypothetical protein
MVCIDVFGWFTTDLSFASLQLREFAILLAFNLELVLAVRCGIERETVEASIFDLVFEHQRTCRPGAIRNFVRLSTVDPLACFRFAEEAGGLTCSGEVVVTFGCGIDGEASFTYVLYGLIEYSGLSTWGCIVDTWCLSTLNWRTLLSLGEFCVRLTIDAEASLAICFSVKCVAIIALIQSSIEVIMLLLASFSR